MIGTVVEAAATDVEAYLDEVMTTLAWRPPSATTGGLPEDLPDRIFDLATSRRFCYLSRSRTAPYRGSTTELIRRRLSRGEPLRFFYDIGPGYHASLRPEESGLRFGVGLSELLILFQISSFNRAVAEIYPPGVRFWLVIDNVCALRTNDIPLERTTGYVERLRTLIRQTELGWLVDLIVESEHVDLQEYDALVAESPRAPLTAPLGPKELENVARFLGRPCDMAEAADRIERYSRTGPVTDRLIDRLVSGVHMTQRATGATLGFRPFPGGDVRTQTGEVVLVQSKRNGLRPALVTSRNVDDYHLHELRLPGLLPETIERVWYAEAPGDASQVSPG